MVFGVWCELYTRELRCVLMHCVLCVCVSCVYGVSCILRCVLMHCVLLVYAVCCVLYRIPCTYIGLFLPPPSSIHRFWGSWGRTERWLNTSPSPASTSTSYQRASQMRRPSSRVRKPMYIYIYICIYTRVYILSYVVCGGCVCCHKNYFFLLLPSLLTPHYSSVFLRLPSHSFFLLRIPQNR